MQLRHHKTKINTLGIEVLLVTFESPEMAAFYVRDAESPWPMMLDSQRQLYHQYGMERGGFWQVMGPHSWWGYIKLLARGRRLKSPTGDVRQLGGDVLIDPEGVIRFHHVTSTPIDRPEVPAILEVVTQGSVNRSP